MIYRDLSLLDLKCFACGKKGHVFKDCKEVHPKENKGKAQNTSNQRKLLIRYPKKKFHSLRSQKETESSACLIQEKFREYLEDPSEDQHDEDTETFERLYSYYVFLDSCLEFNEARPNNARRKSALMERNELDRFSPYSPNFFNSSKRCFTRNEFDASATPDNPVSPKNNSQLASLPFLDPIRVSHDSFSKKHSMIFGKKRKMIQELKRSPADRLHITNKYFPDFNPSFLSSLVNGTFIDSSEEQKESPFISADKMEESINMQSNLNKMEESTNAKHDQSVRFNIIRKVTGRWRSSEGIMEKNEPIDMTRFESRNLGILGSFDESKRRSSSGEEEEVI